MNGRKGIYVRSNEFSSKFEAVFANETELRELFQRRKIVRDRRADLLDRARTRFETFTAQKYHELGRGPTQSIGSRFDLCVVPRFPSR